MVRMFARKHCQSVTFLVVQSTNYAPARKISIPELPHDNWLHVKYKVQSIW